MTGDFRENSDLDLCLIYNEGNEPSLRQKVEIEAYIDDFVGEEMGVDFLYATPLKLETGAGVFDSIRKEGRILWEHSGA